MLFKYITKHRQGKIFEFITCVLIVAFLVTMNGCVTTETRYYTKDNIRSKSEYEIIRVLMKDGSVIELRDKGAKYYEQYKGQKNVIVYLSADSTKVSVNATRISGKERIIDLNDAFSIVVEKEEIDVTLTVLTGLAIATGIALIVILASSGDDPAPTPPPTPIKYPGSCPLVYTFNGSEFNLESETFSGAILKTAERTAYDKLEHLNPAAKQLVLKMTNALQETEYTNELKIIAADVKSNEKVIPDYQGIIHTISSQITPNSCNDFAGKDMRNLVLKNDNIMWQSDLKNMNVSKDEYLKDGLILEFNKPVNSLTAKIVVSGVNTELSVAAINEVLRLQGKNKSAWVEKMEKSPAETQRFINFLKREGMLHVKLWINDQWVEQNVIPDTGPIVPKEQVAMLDLSRVPGTTFRVKLETTTDLWKIDQVYVDYSKDNEVITNELKIISAVDQDGEMVKDILASNDNNYLTANPGDYTIICYENIPLKAGMQRHYILKSKGYYHPWFQSDENENAELYNKIINEPLYGLKYFMSQWKLESVK